VSLDERSLAGTEYLIQQNNQVCGRPQTLDLTAEAERLASLRKAISLGFVNAAHDISEGGLLVAISEMALLGRRGVDISFDFCQSDRLDIQAFGERSGFVVSVPVAKRAEFEQGISAAFSVHRLGEVTGQSLQCSALQLTIGLNELGEAYFHAIRKIMAS